MLPLNLKFQNTVDSNMNLLCCTFCGCGVHFTAGLTAGTGNPVVSLWQWTNLGVIFDKVTSLKKKKKITVTCNLYADNPHLLHVGVKHSRWGQRSLFQLLAQFCEGQRQDRGTFSLGVLWKEKQNTQVETISNCLVFYKYSVQYTKKQTNTVK